MKPEKRSELALAFQSAFLDGQGFSSITEARQIGRRVLGRVINPGSQDAKELEEAVEVGVVGAAKALIAQGEPPRDTYDQLVNLYGRQPTLGTRSSTSVLRQQFSSPLPIAYLAGKLAGVSKDVDVYEPTAGNGALLLLSDPAKTTVNEVDDDRAAVLRRQGYEVSQHDATYWRPDKLHDVIIANPPFGRRTDPETGLPEQFRIGAEETPILTTQIDHAIAWRALEAMRDKGRAVLILGSERGLASQRSDKYNGVQNRGFFFNLYNNYNVVDHFTVNAAILILDFQAFSRR